MTNRITGKLIPKDNRNVLFHADFWPDKPIGGGGGGTSDYEDLDNLPSVNGVELVGNKSFADLTDGLFYGGKINTQTVVQPDTSCYYIVEEAGEYTAFGVTVYDLEKVKMLVYDKTNEVWSVVSLPWYYYGYVHGKFDTLDDIASELDSIVPDSASSSNKLLTENERHFKGWYDTLAKLKAAHTATEGDSAYVKDASPATTYSIYVYDSTASSDNYWADSGTDADTSNVQTFASGEEVNEVHIVNDFTGGVNDVCSAEQGKMLVNMVKFYDENLYNIGQETASTNNTTYITPSSDATSATWTIKKTGGTVGRDCRISIPSLLDGKNYRLSFDYDNSLENEPSVLMADSSHSKLLDLGKIQNGVGSFSAEFLYSSDIVEIKINTLQVSVNDYLTISNVAIEEVVLPNVYVNGKIDELVSSLQSGIDIRNNLLFQAQNLPYWPHTTHKEWRNSTSISSYVIPITPNKEYYYESSDGFQVVFLKSITNSSTLNAAVDYSYYQRDTAYNNITFGGNSGFFKAPSDANYICFIINSNLNSFKRLFLVDDIRYNLEEQIDVSSQDPTYCEYKISLNDVVLHAVLQNDCVSNSASSVQKCLVNIPIEVAGGGELLLSPKRDIGVSIRMYEDKENLNSCVLQNISTYYDDFTGRPFHITLNDRARFVMLQVQINTTSSLVISDIENLFTEIIVPRKKTLEQELSTMSARWREKKWSYTGEKIIPRRNTFTAKYIFPHLDVNINGSTKYRQGCAVFKDYFFQIYADGYCRVFDLKNPERETEIASFNLGCVDQSNHCNAAQFAPTINPETGFPYLYVTLGVSNSQRGISVEKISIDNGVWSSEMVQMITVRREDEENVHGDWIIGDDGFLYGAKSVTNGVQYYKMNCPDISLGNTTIYVEDAVYTWTEDWGGSPNTWQGCMMYNQRFYHLFGTTSVRREIRVFDVNNGKLTTVIPLDSVIAQEPEDLDIWQDKIIISCNDTATSITKGAGTYLLDFC